MLMISKQVTLPGISGVTIYGDDPSDLTYYVLPNHPRFRLDRGIPAFKFLKYKFPIDRGEGKLGGGYCVFDAECVVPDDTMAAVQAGLQELVNQRVPGRPAPPVKVGTIPWLRGTVKMVLQEGDGRIIQKIWSPGKPSLYGNNVACFAVELSQEGSTLFWNALQGKGGFVQVVYDLFAMTKLPPARVTGRFEAEKFYSFQQTIDVEWNFWSEDSYQETVREQFRDSSSYTLTFDWGGLTDPKVQSQIRDWATRTMEDQIEKKMIEAIAPVSAEDRKLPDGIENVTRDISVQKIASFSLNFTEGQTMPDWNPAPQGILPNITNLTGPDGRPLVWGDFAQEVDLNDPFFKQLNVSLQVNADYQELPIHSVEVHLDYPKAGAHEIGEFRFTKSDDVHKFACYIENNNWKYKYWYEVNYKGSSKTYKSPEKETDEKILTVNVDDLGVLSIDIVTGDLNFSQVNHAQVTVQYQDQANGVEPIEQQFTLDKTNPKHRFQQLIFQPRRNPYRYRVKYFMTDGSEYERDWTEGASTQLYINDPFVTKNVSIRAFGDMDNRVDTIFVDLTYTDVANDYTKSHSVALSKENPFDDWSFPVIQETGGTLTYSGTVRLKSGSVVEIKPTEAKRNTILVGLPMMHVEVLPDLIDFTKTRLVKITLHYDDAEGGISDSQDAVFRPGEVKPAVWEFEILDRTKNEYEWRADYFMADGTSRKIEPRRSREETIVMPEVPA